ncbi:hypothetical protein JTE90_008534 [Oedothorax gibbosus]|uniref:Uncharacterized protein n=1 Tax=Oedothorax gibbosus TaxID=931172 RepID=A0AAV6VGC8_9ARAC|nr:hypothetical protein JTE90_008533 [Oedothorax gibbosus]KAG8195841.1 hypothetical protein JTE90_008534 [Oedothorax gibbosus]
MRLGTIPSTVPCPSLAYRTIPIQQWIWNRWWGHLLNEIGYHTINSSMPIFGISDHTDPTMDMESLVGPSTQ